jgi:hypothetical protein
MTDTADLERRHEGPSYWVNSSLADLIACADEFQPWPDDEDGDRILADLRTEIARRQQAIKEGAGNG